MSQQNLSSRADSAREHARTSGGQFGDQPRSEAGFELCGDTAPRALRTVTVPERDDGEAMIRFVGEEVVRHRQRLHGGDPTVHYDGEEIIAELQRKPAGATLTDEQLGEFLEEHQYLDPEDFETVRAGPWSRLMGRPDVVRPRVGVQSTWP